MTPRTEIPFFGNHNNASCGQCLYRMALTHFFPEQPFSITDMDALCGAVEGKGTWPYLPVTKLTDMGLKTVTYDVFDTEQFVKSPVAYLHEFYGAEMAQYAIESSDMDLAVAQAQTYIDYLNLNKLSIIKSYHNADILRGLLDDGYLINLWVNSRILNNKDGLVGHFILVHGYEGKNFIAHDPGGNDENGNAVDQYPHRIISEDKLYAACCVKAGETDTLIAIKR